MGMRGTGRSNGPARGSIQIGEVTVTPFVSSRFRLDGGSMFGVIPRPLWERKAPPDGLNRIPLNSNSLLVETDGTLVLVEPGMGAKYSGREREIYELDDIEVVKALEGLGIDRREIDLVVPTHLHLDHAGGCTERGGREKAVPAFENARVLVQRLEWEAAAAPHPLSAGSYRPEDFEPLEEAGLMQLLDGDTEIAPGLTVELTGGHTPGHQVLRIASSGAEAIFIGDLVPTTAHLKLNWLMAWDLDPLTVYERRAALLEECASRGTLLFTAHDPLVAACRLCQAGTGAFVVEDGSRLHAAAPGGAGSPPEESDD